MKDYPTRYTELKTAGTKLGKQTPELLTNFHQLEATAMQDAVLSRKVKELIALGIAVAVRCDGCIAHHVRDALYEGASEDEIIETLGVAVLMGGGPSMIYTEEAFVAMKQFEHFGNKALKRKL